MLQGVANSLPSSISARRPINSNITGHGGLKESAIAFTSTVECTQGSEILRTILSLKYRLIMTLVSLSSDVVLWRSTLHIALIEHQYVIKAEDSRTAAWLVRILTQIRWGKLRRISLVLDVGDHKYNCPQEFEE